MGSFERRDFYMKWLYRIAYKLYMMNPWADCRYFDFMCMQYAHNGKKVRYVVNFEDYRAVTGAGDDFSAKTVWLHLCGDDSEKVCEMRAFCCVFSPIDKIPKSYSEEVQKWKKQPFSDALTPFFVDFSAGTPKSLDFEASKQLYYLLSNTYSLLMSYKRTAPV